MSRPSFQISEVDAELSKRPEKLYDARLQAMADAIQTNNTVEHVRKLNEWARRQMADAAFLDYEGSVLRNRIELLKRDVTGMAETLVELESFAPEYLKDKILEIGQILLAMDGKLNINTAAAFIKL